MLYLSYGQAYRKDLEGTYGVVCVCVISVFVRACGFEVCVICMQISVFVCTCSRLYVHVCIECVRLCDESVCAIHFYMYVHVHTVYLCLSV